MIDGSISLDKAPIFDKYRSVRSSTASLTSGCTDSHGWTPQGRVQAKESEKRDPNSICGPQRALNKSVGSKN